METINKPELHRWLKMAQARVSFQGLPSRICWLGYKERQKVGLAFNELVRKGEVKGPIVIGRDHLDCGSVASPNRETEGMLDGSDAIADWPILNALLSVAGGASWTSVHHGGGVGILGKGSDGSGGPHGSDGSPGSGGSGSNYGGGGGGAKGGPTGPYGTWPSADGDAGSGGAVRIVYSGIGTIGDRDYSTLVSIADTTYNNTTNNTAYDLTSSNITGTLGPDDTIPAFVQDGTTGTFEFNSEVNQFIEFSNTSSLNYPMTTSVTLSVFVKFDAVGQWVPLFTKNRSTNTYLGLWLTDTSVASFYAHGSGLLGSTTLTADTWYHIVGVQEANTSRKIYVNGILDGTKTSSFGTDQSGSQEWYIGKATGTSQYMDGKMSHVCLYDRALTAAEVLQIYNTLKRRYN